MGKLCYELNPNCFVRKMRQGDSPCPAFNSIKCCWEIDWPKLLETIPKEDGERWRSFMMENCPNCPVYDLHTKELKDILKRLKTLQIQ
jgi:hypothetical protein